MRNPISLPCKDQDTTIIKNRNTSERFTERCGSLQIGRFFIERNKHICDTPFADDTYKTRYSPNKRAFSHIELLHIVTWNIYGLSESCTFYTVMQIAAWCWILDINSACVFYLLQAFFFCKQKRQIDCKPVIGCAWWNWITVERVSLGDQQSALPGKLLWSGVAFVSLPIVSTLSSARICTSMTVRSIRCESVARTEFAIASRATRIQSNGILTYAGLNQRQKECNLKIEFWGWIKRERERKRAAQQTRRLEFAKRITRKKIPWLTWFEPSDWSAEDLFFSLVFSFFFFFRFAEQLRPRRDSIPEWDREPVSCGTRLTPFNRGISMLGM